MEPTVVAPATVRQEFSGADFRRALGVFATGVTVITTRGADEDDLFAMTANAFSSVSLDPPLVLVCVMEGSAGNAAIARNGLFAVNILSAEQEAISNFFARRDRPRGREAFHEIPHGFSVTGAPILHGTVAHLDCRLEATHKAGDHVIFIGEVLGLGVDDEARPLLFHEGRYSLVRD
jgi:flavin reductase (DIM6/NTAB) family NADH-FMN oxidoreductase RutF